MTAYRIETERLVLRCFSPDDAPKLQDAIDASLDHLRPWMPWAKDEPESLEAKVEKLRRFRGSFDHGTDYPYAILARDESAILGAAGLHARIGPGALEIGYWIHARRTREGLASEAAAALTRVAFEVHNVGRVEIHCDPTNVASAGVPAKLGYTHDATLRRRARRPDGTERGTMIWSIFRDEYVGSVAAKARVAAFDAGGQGLV